MNFKSFNFFTIFKNIKYIDSNNYTNNIVNINRNSIIISLENLGWLNKNTINGLLNNWAGDPYRSEPFIKSWRNYFFWDRYTEEQMDALSKLCESLCEKHEIPKKSVPSQGYLEKVGAFFA